MRSVVFGLAVLGLVGCATPYQENGFLGGVSAVAMGGDVYRISGHLNAFSSQEQLQDFMLLRAADTAIAQGAVGFIILGYEDATRSSTLTSPGESSTTAQVTTYGNTAYGTAQTTYTPADTTTFILPGGIALIQLVRNPSAGQKYLIAADIEQAIGPRVRDGH